MLNKKNVSELGDGTFPEIEVGSCGVIKYVELIFVFDSTEVSFLSHLYSCLYSVQSSDIEVPASFHKYSTCSGADAENSEG